MDAPPISRLRLPAREFLLASLPPGLGHLRARQSRGISLLAGFLFLLYVAVNPAHYAVPPPPWGLALAGLAVFLLFWLYAARDLERSTGPDPLRGRPTPRPWASGPRGRGPRSR